jgi:hypothetical protein
VLNSGQCRNLYPLIPEHAHVVVVAAEGGGRGEAARRNRRHVAARHNLPRQIHPGARHSRRGFRHFLLSTIRYSSELRDFLE